VNGAGKGSIRIGRECKRGSSLPANSKKERVVILVVGGQQCGVSHWPLHYRQAGKEPSHCS
jgi:hypothetical protein